MKKLLLVIMAAFMLPLFGCPKEEEPPPADQVEQPDTKPAEPAEKRPDDPIAAKAFDEINADNVADKAKAMEEELKKEAEAAKALGAEEAEGEEKEAK